MKDNSRFFIVDKKVLPEIFAKVVEAKKLIESYKANTVKEAIDAVGISRSAFYKYRDSVFEASNNIKGQTLIIGINLENIPGLLSNVLNVIADEGANIITINQNIPIGNIANVNITVETNKTNDKLVEFVQRLEKISGVHSLEIIAKE